MIAFLIAQETEWDNNLSEKRERPYYVHSNLVCDFFQTKTNAIC